MNVFVQTYEDLIKLLKDLNIKESIEAGNMTCTYFEAYFEVTPDYPSYEEGEDNDIHVVFTGEAQS